MDPTIPEQCEIMGVGVHPLTLKETTALIGDWISRSRREEAETTTRQVVTLNVEMLYQACRDPLLRSLLQQCDLVVPDSHGVVWAGRRRGYRIPERVTGIDLIWSLAEAASEERWRLYLFGSRPGVAEEAAVRLAGSHPGLVVVGSRHGYFSPAQEAELVAEIREKHPDLLLVGLGSPKQEYFIREHRNELGAAVAMGVGGSFDVISGRLRRAPLIFQRLHLEWVYRLLQEPSRWRRMMVLPRFALRVLLDRTR